MKQIIGTILAIGTIMGVAFYSMPTKANDLRTQAIMPVYKIQMGEATCSAVGVAPVGKDEEEAAKKVTVLLTAKHCIRPDHKLGKVLIETVTDKSTSVEFRDFTVMGVSETTDLAAIVTPGVLEKAPVAIEQVAQEGDDVWSVGYPLGISRVTTKGILGTEDLQEHPSNDLVRVVHASTNIEEGMSGGPLYQLNNNRYEVIGIASTKVTINNFQGTFIPLKSIQEFMKNGK